MRVLDLCCGAGGAAVGYARAGFDVVGVDTLTQPHYPFEFHQADALTFPLEGFDAVHASPPCQAYSDLARFHPERVSDYVRLIEPLRDRFRAAGIPYVLENVVGAPLVDPVTLCGSMFDLVCERGWLRRHRLFERSFPVPQPACRHPKDWQCLGVYGGGGNAGMALRGTASERRELMGIDWMTTLELNQAIPPAYTFYIGAYLVLHLTGALLTIAASRQEGIMPEAKTTKDATGGREGRFVVSLPKEVGVKIDALGRKMRTAVEATLGVAPDLSRAQVVQSLVDSSLRRLEEIDQNAEG